MMGSGKTTIAQQLSQKLNIPSYDSDQYIEQQTKLSISQIFNNYGETYFRNLEKKHINELIRSRQDLIISCGGGSFIIEEVRNILLNTTTTFWLNTSSTTIYARIKNDTTRPLLAQNNSINNIDKILKKRIRFYKQAHHQINTDNISPEELSDKIIAKLQQIN